MRVSNQSRVERNARKKHKPTGSMSAQVKRLEANKFYQGVPKAIKHKNGSAR